MENVIVSSKEFRLNFPKYQSIVEKGIPVVIVKRSKPIFRLEPVDLVLENKVTDALMRLENNEEGYVKYDEVF